MESYRDRFVKCCASAMAKDQCNEVYNQLIMRHSEEHRCYHNFDHVKFCLEKFDSVKSEINDPLALELALWFHDAVYDTKSDRNEDASAELAIQSLDKIGMSDQLINKVYKLILLTKHVEEPESKDGKYIIDIDLAVLGASPDIFSNYETNIRREYSWVSANIFKVKRSEILKSFLNRGRIYYTDYFYKNYEKTARDNLKIAIQKLKR